jgi:hypothetical protein
MLLEVLLLSENLGGVWRVQLLAPALGLHLIMKKFVSESFGFLGKAIFASLLVCH